MKLQESTIYNACEMSARKAQGEDQPKVNTQIGGNTTQAYY